ncbi:hypothetical protein NLI96_g4990 [Meripilus lineatus]|uniref:Uncharacterized protein n=1 Tax=Meripilus lineatus TaxID=2056292 RepID=A0AAD5YEA2_9APHY|nr:hypothetical protein NLI96_g4990 [Physisporinus lineatus]
MPPSPSTLTDEEGRQSENQGPMDTGLIVKVVAALGTSLLFFILPREGDFSSLVSFDLPPIVLFIVVLLGCFFVVRCKMGVRRSPQALATSTRKRNAPYLLTPLSRRSSMRTVDSSSTVLEGVTVQDSQETLVDPSTVTTPPAMPARAHTRNPYSYIRSLRTR